MVNIRADDDQEPQEVLAQFSLEQRERLEEMRRDAALYDRMAASIAPNVHGHTDVKRAVLLMLLGGMHKTTKEVRERACACGKGCRWARDGVAWGSASREERVPRGGQSWAWGALSLPPELRAWKPRPLSRLSAHLLPLLLLLACLPACLPQGINLRGDINVAIVGDPACAKSQMLK